MPPRSGESVTVLRSASPRILLSRVDLIIPATNPRAIPTRSPIRRLSFVLGAEGILGALAGLMMDRLTGEVPPVLGFSKESTVLIRLSAVA